MTNTATATTPIRLEVLARGNVGWIDADRHAPHEYADRAEAEREGARRQASHGGSYRVVGGPAEITESPDERADRWAAEDRAEGLSDAWRDVPAHDPGSTPETCCCRDCRPTGRRPRRHLPDSTPASADPNIAAFMGTIR